MNIQKQIADACVQTGVQPQNKDDALKRLAELVTTHPLGGKLQARDVFQKMLAREDIGSTGFGGGIAIPHCAVEGIEDFIVAIMTAPEGVNFKALDGKPVHLFVGIVAPAEMRSQHIHLLSAVSSVLRQPEIVAKMTATQSPDELRAYFLSHIAGGPRAEEKREHNLVQVFVQRRDPFEQILGFFTEIPDCSITVIEAENVDRYLHTIPLFASFWSEESRGFHCVICAVVDKSVTNELVRKINQLIDAQKGGDGIMVIVQSLVYVNGRLSL